jgi:hypothetical protein
MMFRILSEVFQKCTFTFSMVIGMLNVGMLSVVCFATP